MSKINLRLKTYDELTFEISRLNTDKYLLEQKLQQKENIINELEKWLVEWREMLDCPDLYEEGIIDCINDTLTKLQELKGSDKE